MYVLKDMVHIKEEIAELERECQELEQRSVASAPLLADTSGLDTGGTGLLTAATSHRPVGARTRGFVCVKVREEIFHT